MPAEFRLTPPPPSRPRREPAALWSRMRRDYSLAMLCMTFSLPFLVPLRHFPILGFYPEWAALAFGTLAVLGLAWAKEARPPVPSLLWMPASLGAVAVLQFLDGRIPYVQQLLIWLGYMIWMAALISLGAHLSREGEARVSVPLARAVVAGATLAALTGWMQWAGLDESLFPWIAPHTGGGITGNIGQPNQLALYVALGLASLGYLLGIRRIGPVLAAPVAVLMVFVLLLTGSRAGNALLPGLLACCVVLHLLARSDATRRQVGFALVLVICQAVLAWTGGGELPARYAGSAVSAAGHWNLWTTAWSIFLDAPLTGAGFGQFAWAALSRTADAGGFPGSVMPSHAHSLPLQLLAESGLAGLLAVLAPAALLAARIRWQSLSMGQGWALTLVALVLAASMFEYPLWHAYFLGVTAVLAGMLCEAGPPRPASVAHRVAVVACVATAVAALTGAIADHAQLRRAVAPLPGEPRMDAIDRYRILAGLRRESLLAPWAEWSLTDLYLLDPGAAERHLAASERAVRFLPTRHRVYEHALMLEFAGRHAQARAQLALAGRAYPADWPRFADWVERNAGERLWQVDGLREVLRAGPVR